MRALAFLLASGAAAVAGTPRQDPPAVEKIAIPEAKLSFEVASLKGGPVKVGSPESEKDRKKDEAIREVTLQPFQIGMRKVTWAEFNAYYETKDPPGVDAVTRPTRAKSFFGQVNIPAHFLDSERPATNVRWHSAIGYCWWLSVKTGLVRAIKTGAPVTVTASKGHKGPSGSATVTVN